jgi:hypothetical protein
LEPSNSESKYAGQKRVAGTLLEWSVGKASTGTPQVVLVFETEGGARETFYGALTEKAFPYTRDALMACGWRGESSSTMKQDIRRGTRVELVLGPELSQQGRTVMRLRFVNRLRRAPESNLSREEKLDLAESIDVMCELAKNVTGAVVEPGVEPAEDDDIPF